MIEAPQGWWYSSRRSSSVLCPRSSGLQVASSNDSVLRERRTGFELRHYSVGYFIYTGGSRCMLVVPALVEEFLKTRRDYFLLNAIIINLPWARARKERDAWSFST